MRPGAAGFGYPSVEDVRDAVRANVTHRGAAARQRRRREDHMIKVSSFVDAEATGPADR